MKINTKKIMVESLNEASASLNNRNIILAKKRILKDLGKNTNESYIGEVGTDIITNLLIEAMYSFTSSRDKHNVSYLASKVFSLLESELAWARISNSIPKADRSYLIGFVNAVNKTQAKNFKLDPVTKFNVVKLLTKLDPRKLGSNNPMRKILAPKKWKTFASKIAKDVSAIRSLIFLALENFGLNHPDYEVEANGHNTIKIIKIINVGSEIKQYMFTESLPLTKVEADRFDLYRSIQTQSVEVSLQSAYTFNTDYNAAIEAIIESGNHVKYFDAENDAALKAKVDAVENDVRNGLNFWNELGQGNVYFNYVVDFRGRISQLGGLSAVGHKVGKAMLRAGITKKLGTTGFKHILIALGSSMGHDKMTLNDREVWGYDNMDTYVEIGEELINNPVAAFEKLYTLDADNIFDAAAISLELYYISQFDGQIEDYKSNLFVGYDATCSGLQIVALLWGNKMLAENTNVAKFDETEDKIYDIYKYLYEAMDVVAENFNPTTDSTPDGEEMLKVWQSLVPKIQRAIAKVLLMPRIYGSTFRTWSDNTRKVAGKKNIFAYIKDDKEREIKLFQFGIVVANLFKKTFDKESGFQAFRDFDDVVGQVATAYNSNKKDTTWTINEPSTFNNQHIIAKYRELDTARYYVYKNNVKVKVSCYSVSIFEDELQKVSKINVKKSNIRKAKNAISPNFVHSLDALLLHTVNYSMKTSMRLTHDCFGCTPGDVEKMLNIINISYIELFGGNNNIIVKLAEETERNTNIKINIPETLNNEGINIDAINKGTYKFN